MHNCLEKAKFIWNNIIENVIFIYDIGVLQKRIKNEQQFSEQKVMGELMLFSQKLFIQLFVHKRFFCWFKIRIITSYYILM